MRKYERLERAVRKQLAKGRAARRKLYELRHTIERRKNRKRARAAEKAAARGVAARRLRVGRTIGYRRRARRPSRRGSASSRRRRRYIAGAAPSVPSTSAVDDSSDDEVVDPLQQALQGVDRAAMASHLSLVTLGLVGYDLIQSEDYSFRRLATLAACNSVLALPRRRGEEGGAQGGHGCIRCAGDAPTGKEGTAPAHAHDARGRPAVDRAAGRNGTDAEHVAPQSRRYVPVKRRIISARSGQNKI